ncbi:MAG: PIG-L deacetylase family protein [Dehalococcoidia bacterium]
MTANLEGLAQQPPADVDPSERRALVIAAHPDDADFGAAGTAALWTREGWEFTYLVCTNGAKGSDDESMTPAQLIRMRRDEQRAAAMVLGVKDVMFLDYEDGELTPSRDFLGDVVKAIRTVRPTAVFTHDPEAVIVNNAFVNHSDHRATGLTAIDAIYPAARDRMNFPEQIAEGLSTHKVSQIYIWGTERDNFKVDITDVIQTKVDALLAHTSQFEEEFVRRMLEIWRTPEGRYFESFRRVLMAF